ncbi:arylalkylamine N-acetyltransferase-like 2 [Musca vetustissima]|uniref:arylalkylamine N-acetyltransferase-like 2 n=1 Tax=Musca vetustissima TaxID=27455 RepID=UPI002AB69541|nr:arylalkylamine N-acetyltransferase-like 2 [Musca vetustissima]
MLWSLVSSLIKHSSVSHTIVTPQYVLSPRIIGKCSDQLLCRRQQNNWKQSKQIRHQLNNQLGNSNQSGNMANIDNIRISVIQPEDRQRVLDFLRIHYYCEEPLTVGREPKQQDPADEEFNLSNINHGTCLMAINTETESIVGAVLAGPKGPDEAEHLFEEAAAEGQSKWGIILKFLAGVERDANVFQRYGVQKALHAHVLGVDGEMRGKNIGGRLMSELMRLGKKLGYEILTADCTSYYSARLCERLGWECINAAYYADYVDDVNKKPVFVVQPPHDCCRTFAQRL